MRSPVFLIAVLTAAAVALGGCQKHLQAPAEENVCYFLGHPAKDQIKFNVVGRNVPDVEHCAVLVYNLRQDMLRTGTAADYTEGAYGGNFIWVNNHEVRFARYHEGPTSVLLVHSPDGRLIQPGAIMYEDDTAQASGPATVELPQEGPAASK